MIPARLVQYVTLRDRHCIEPCLGQILGLVVYRDMNSAFQQESIADSLIHETLHNTFDPLAPPQPALTLPASPAWAAP